MGKNAHLHIVLDTKDLIQLKEEASFQGIRLSELCRQKLKQNSQINKLESKMDLLIKYLSK